MWVAHMQQYHGRDHYRAAGSRHGKRTPSAAAGARRLRGFAPVRCAPGRNR